MKLLGVFLSKTVERVSVCVFLWWILCDVCPRFNWTKDMVVARQVIRAGNKKSVSPHYTALNFGVFKIHCVFQYVQKTKIPQRLSYVQPLLWSKGRWHFLKSTPRLFTLKRFRRSFRKYTLNQIEYLGCSFQSTTRAAPVFHQLCHFPTCAEIRKYTANQSSFYSKSYAAVAKPNKRLESQSINPTGRNSSSICSI